MSVLDLQAAGLLFPLIWCLLLVVSEAILETSAGFLGEGLVPAYWWVKLGPGPMVGRAMSGAYFRGGCGLRKSLESLSA